MSAHPSHWQCLRLGDLAAKEKYALAIGPFGSNLKASDYCVDGVPLVFVREIRKESFGEEGARFLSHEKASALKPHWVRPGDLLITKMGKPPGDTAIYPASRPPGIITADCIKMTVGPLSTAPFLKLWLRTPKLKHRMLEATKGIAQEKLSLDRFREITIELPPLSEQHRIVEKLESLQQKSAHAQEALHDLPRLLALFRSSTLAYACSGRLTADVRKANPRKSPAKSLRERMLPERERRSLGLPKLPPGWCWARLARLATIVTGRTPKSKQCYGGDVPFYKPRDLNAGYDLHGAEESLKPTALEHVHLLAPESILINCIGTSLGKTGFARSACATNQQINALLPSAQVKAAYLFWACTSPFAQAWMRAHASATTIPILSKRRLAEMPIPVPPDVEQEALCRRLEQIHRRQQAIAEACKHLSNELVQLDRAILEKAIAGDLLNHAADITTP